MTDPVQIVCPHCAGLNRVPAGRLGDDPRCGHCREPLLDGRPVDLDGARLARHVAKDGLPLLVDFWAAWCGPCRQMAPVFTAAAAEYRGRVRFARLDTEADPGAAAGYGIRGIPTLILFQHGRERDRLSGALDRGALSRWLNARVQRPG